MTVFRRTLLALALTPLLSAGAALAQPPGDDGHRGPPREPPPAAYDACKDKKADDACEVTFGDRTVKGTCATTPAGRLACRPQPPPELIKACEGKKDGDSCSVQLGDHGFTGQCHQGRGDTLVCRPS
jgi:hypothetical protein